MPHRCWTPIFGALFIVACWSAASDTQQTQKPSTPVLDLYGDPLPEGVLARLGTVKWRHASHLMEVFFAGDDKTLVSAGGIGVWVGIWDADTGRLRHKIVGSGVCYHLAVSPDGKVIVTDQLNLIDVKTGQEIRRLAPRPNNIHLVAFSPDGRVVVAGEYFFQQPPKITLWDVATGNEIRKIEGHPVPLCALAFSADGKVLATGGTDRTIRFWDIATGKVTRQLNSEGANCSSLAFSPDGKVLASVDDGGAISQWDLATGKVIRELKSTDGHMVHVVYSRDGKKLASADSESKVMLWDPQTGLETRHWSVKGMGSLTFSPDGKTLVTGGIAGNTIRRWETATGKEIDPPTGHTAPILAMHFAPDGRTLISRSKDNAIVEWDLSPLRQRRVVFSESAVPVKKNWYWDIKDNSADGNSVAILGYQTYQNPKVEFKSDPVVYLWNTAAGMESHALAGHAEQPQRVAFSPDGKYLATKAKDEVRLWEVDTGKQVHQWPEQARQICFTPDSKRLVICGPDKKMRFCDVTSNKEVLAWDTKLEKHNELRFSQDGRLLASFNSTQIVIWVADSGKEIRQIVRLTPKSSVLTGVLSATGRIVAIVEQETRPLPTGDHEMIATIRLVETLSGDEIRRIVIPQSNFPSVAFSPDGRSLACGSGDSTIVFWDMTGQAIPGQLGKYNTRPAPTEKDLATLWTELGSDAAKAEKALWALVFSPKESTPFLKERLKYGPAADAKEVAKIVATLGGDSFADRQKAAQSLEKLGESAEAAVRAHLEGKITLEVRQRLQQFLQNREKDAIRKLRAIEAVEQIGTAEASVLLQVLAQESPNPRVAESAAAALARLEKRVSKE